MKNKLFHATILLAMLFATSIPAFGWGEKGHNAIAHIAQKHLTRRAEREVTRLLDGHNLAYPSAWADGLRNDRRYDAFTTWHYANADEGQTYATAHKEPAGDVYTAVNFCVEQLEKKGASDSLRGMYLKLLIHFVGDMHCPMHAGRASDRGGNDFAIDFRGTGSNLHRLWDSQLPDAAHPWSAYEWALNIDHRMSRAERDALSAGTSLEWMEETVRLSHLLYADTPQDEPIGWPYINKYSPLAEQKFLEAGHRLARLLNEIFGR